MSDFVKNIVKLAREYRASEQDARFSYRYAKVIIANYGYDDLKKFIVKRKIYLICLGKMKQLDFALLIKMSLNKLLRELILYSKVKETEDTL